MKQIKLKDCAMGAQYYRKYGLKPTRSKWQECLGWCLVWVFIGVGIQATLKFTTELDTRESLVCNFVTNCVGENVK